MPIQNDDHIKDMFVSLMDINSILALNDEELNILQDAIEKEEYVDYIEVENIMNASSQLKSLS
jgi:hypothetical protein